MVLPSCSHSLLHAVNQKPIQGLIIEELNIPCSRSRSCLSHFSIDQRTAIYFQGLTNLEYVDCSKNQIEYLPIGLEDCHTLKTLLLKSNCIREVPVETCHLATLEVVDLGDNLLESAPPVNFTKTLQLFNIQGNKFNKGFVYKL